MFFVCMFDAPEAFDRVYYAKLFNLLRERRLLVMVTWVLLDMCRPYTRQRMPTYGKVLQHFTLKIVYILAF